jgi:hypothetical protein
MPTAVGSKVTSKKTFVASVTAMIAGITKDLTTTMSLTVGGTSMTRAQILTQLNSILALFNAITNARNQLTSAVAAKNAGGQAAKQFMVDLKKAVEAQFGSSSAELQDFGIPLPKPKATRTSAEKAASAGLAKQTRLARGTKGKVQKADITVAGKPCVVVVGPDGQPLAGVTGTGPTPPAVIPGAGSSTPAATPAPASSTPVVGVPAVSAPSGSGTSGSNAG